MSTLRGAPIVTGRLPLQPYALFWDAKMIKSAFTPHSSTQRQIFLENNKRYCRAHFPTSRGSTRRVSPCPALPPQQDVLDAAQYMEDVYEELASRAISGYLSASSSDSTSRYLIGVAGGPGSGKSTLAKEVVRRINERQGGLDVAVDVPMDGFHLYKRELDALPDPKEAYFRRGAHWTFNASAFLKCLTSLKERGGETLTAPSFDHGTGDPVADGVRVLPHHKIVISEGNYLLLDVEPWTQLMGLFDDTWYIDCLIDTAMQRVFQRQTGNGTAPEVSRQRIAGNDRLNAELISKTRGRARLLVPSVPFRKESSEN